MATGDFWNVDNPLKPWGYFDPDAKLDIQFDWATWLSGEGTTYASHTFVVAAGLKAVSSSEAGGVVTVRIAKDDAVDAPALVVGQKYAITCHLVDSDGQEEDQTVYLNMREK